MITHKHTKGTVSAKSHLGGGNNIHALNEDKSKQPFHPVPKILLEEFKILPSTEALCVRPFFLSDDSLTQISV